MKQIILTQGKVALVDNTDYDYLKGFNWYILKSRHTCYAMRRGGILIHRVILDAPKKLEVDHINQNGLDNRRVNLRLCNHAQNIRHQRLNSRNTSGYKGVTVVKDVPQKPFRARIKVNNRTICLGYYQTAREAAGAYDIAALKYHNAFAKTNQMIQGDCGGKRGRRSEVVLNGSSRPMHMRDHQLEYFGFEVSCRVQIPASRRKAPSLVGVLVLRLAGQGFNKLALARYRKG